MAAAGSISGNVFNDLDGEGVKDSGEGPLSNWRVWIDTDRDGTLDAGEPNQLTAADGSYRFNNLTPGVSYRVREAVQSGWRRTTPSGGYHSVTPSAGQAVTGTHFGNTRNVLISGTVFNDLDGDRVKDPGEAGLSGWRVYIDADNDGVFDSGTEPSTLTDSAGNWKFRTLAAGSFHVRVVRQSGWSRTTPTAGTPAGSFDFTLSSGGSRTGLLFDLRRI